VSDQSTSKNGTPIRLTQERWEHIITGHAELAELRQQILGTVTDPERILAGNSDELLAVSEIASGKWLVVIYHESDSDGFIITAFLTRRYRTLAKRKVLWSRPSNI
jgi:hypothetical protein